MPPNTAFHRILLAAAVPEVPQALVNQLKPGGALIAPVGEVPKPEEMSPNESIRQRLTKIIRTETGVTEEVLIPVLFVPMLSGLP